jgi:nucleotide-binding universal stress UspA family protein
MAEPEPDLGISRILLALDASARGLAAVRAAAELAASLRAEIEALFVEDINLLRLAELPFAREVGLLSASGRPLGFAELELALRVQAAGIQRLLDEAARRQNLNFRFNVTRGRVLPEVMSKVGEVDLVVLGKAGRAPAARIGSPEHPARPVVAVFDGAERGYRALEAALRVAAGIGRGLTLLVTEPNPSRYAEVRGRTEAWLKRRGHKARLRQAPGRALADVVGSLRGLRAEALVLQMPEAGLSEEELVALLDAVSGPVLLVR